jgi:ABC-type spermidine/putrescine transport system permease subunit II
VAIGTALLTALVATPAALALTRYRFRWRGTLSAFFTVPLALPTLILGVSLLLLFSAMKVRLSLLTVDARMTFRRPDQGPGWASRARIRPATNRSGIDR